jgi:hypothetical protein
VKQQQQRMDEAARDMNESFQMKIAVLEGVVKQLTEDNERITSMASGLQERLQSKTVDLARTVEQIWRLAVRFGVQPGQHEEVQADVEKLEQENEVLRQRLTTMRDELLARELAAHTEQADMHNVLVHNRFAALASDDSDDDE